MTLGEVISVPDTMPECKAQKSITEAIVGVTGIIVAYGLSTIIHADKIIILNKLVIE